VTLPGGAGGATLVLGVLAVLAALSSRFQLRAITRLRSGPDRILREYGVGDVLFLAAVLGWLLVQSVLVFLSGGGRPVGRPELHGGLLFYGILAGGVWLAVQARGRDPVRLFGLAVSSPGSAARTGLGYLAAGYPLLVAGLVLMNLIFPGTEPQGVVRFFAETRDFGDRALVFLTAAVCAPLTEELIFRGYLHGVARRYLGVGPAALLNASVFAAIHLHAVYFPVLLMLGLLLTLAYELEGNLLVPVVMHAAFNAVSLLVLLVAPGAGT